MPTGQSDVEDIDKEVQFLRRLSVDGGHRNIVHFHRTVNDLTGTSLLFELCDPRDFWQLLIKRGALLEKVRYYGLQLLDGLSFMHISGILHCDLKPNHILVGKGMVLKIADVGMVEDIAEQDRFPFDEILPLPEDFLQDVQASDDAKDVLRGMLNYDPGSRLEVSTFRALPFFHQGYCPPSLPAYAESGGKKFMQGGKGKTILRGCGETRVVAAIELEDADEAAAAYNAEVSEAEAMSEEVRVIERILRMRE
ncbi:hypothetical protein BGZ95_010970 [Linnemannia exigua]|uniref:Protein kinase domain-containing protein n=1 Tax=Linnemannia exigua TaxID=604196 RepID=A0AAD4DAJ9_9FUNG|nr:hypothetical protein BGZ95_010970 [Linnemannia exigua]